MWRKVADWFGGDAFPGETQEVKERVQNDAIANGQDPTPNTFVPGPDYTVAPPQENEEMFWVATPKAVIAHPDYDYDTIKDHMGYADPALPQAHGTLEVHQNHQVLFHLEAGNMAIHVLEKQLRKWCNSNHWKYTGITDVNGNPLADTQKTAMPMRPDDWQEHAPHDLYHLTDAWTWENVISKEGLRPQGETQNPSALGWGLDDDDPLRSRQGHVYLSTRSLQNNVSYANRLGDPDLVILRIDPSYLDPSNIDADEDAYSYGDIFPSAVIPKPNEWIDRGQGGSQGEWADQHSWYIDHPDRTPEAMLTSGSIAYRGTIPPQAISLAWENPETTMDPIQTTASVEGIGEQIPEGGWRTTDGDGNWGQDVDQVDYYGISDADNDSPHGGLCPECGEYFGSSAAWSRHMPEHVQTWDTSDEPFPANQSIYQPAVSLPVESSIRAEHAKMMRVAAAQISGPLPFLYNINDDRIYAGHPGQRHSDIPMSFSPGGVVRGFYMPNGEMVIRVQTDMPYTLYGMTRAWYYLHPELEIKRISLLEGEKKIKLASSDLAHQVRTLCMANVAARTALAALEGHDVYVVGGAVRDTLLGKPFKDIDLVVAIDQPTLHELLAPVGKVSHHGQAFGVSVFKVEDDEVEIALPRMERSTGLGHTDFEVTASPSITIEQDLARRDFSANTMAVNLRTGELIDPYDGASDVACGVTRVINDQAFEEDPLRILRALTSYSRHGLEPDARTREYMQSARSGLKHLSAERVGMELDKLLSGDKPDLALRLALDLELFEDWLPEIQRLNGFDQKSRYHDKKLDDHTLQVVANMVTQSDDLDLRWAAFLHDIGKPDSQWVDEDGFGHYYFNKTANQGKQHEEVGEVLAAQILRRLKFSNERIERISTLVGHHMFPVFTKESGARRFVNRVGDHAEDLITLRWADAGGKKYGFPPQVPLMRQLVAHVREKDSAVSVKQLAVNGNDLMEIGYQPSAQMGQTLSWMLDQVIENPALNDRPTLLKMAKAALDE